MSKISEPNKVYMESVIRKEGFHYAFTGYSDFDDIQDETFHEFRKKYLEALEKFAKYMELDVEHWG